VEPTTVKNIGEAANCTKMEEKNKLRVVDFFCGAGGFTEGFRQMGYEIVYGFDYWTVQP